jgi:hypothetical protein
MLNFSILATILSCDEQKTSDTSTPNTPPSDTAVPIESQDLDGDGFSVADGDCDDEDASVYPGAPIWYNDGIDQDCQDGDELCDYPCYDSCDEPYDSELTYTVNVDIFTTYLNEEGILTEEKCEQICYDLGWDYMNNVIDVYECRDDGVDADSNHLVYCSTLNAPYCEGRLHQGAECSETRSSTMMGSWFARAAQAEATSVQSFLILAKQLKALGAPQELQDACMQASVDEVLHARQMVQLAHKHGSDLPKLSFGTYSEKSALDLAMENVVEGCVREGFAALQALHQAQHAKDPSIRSTMSKIAFDEAKHVELAFRIDMWLQKQLTKEERTKVATAKQDALGSLQAYLQQHKPHPCSLELGLIESQHSLQIFELFQEAIA